ncbi:MAG: hypothetical protein QOI54_3762 [Actinomycetota bacterium]|jgi:hypothetical protein|nr:hypothetical protein [Actinomycetota bacterium]
MSQLSSYGGSKKFQFEATGYFRLEQGDNRWWLVDPEGNGFLSVGLNHIDDSDLKYDHNLDLWKERYGGSRDRWIKEGVAPDLKNWGFNTIGWTQQYIGGGWREKFDWSQIVVVEHGAQWTTDDFVKADTPFIVHMRLAENENWNGRPFYPDPFDADFEDHCAYLARSICADLAENKNLLGYSFVDAPLWYPHPAGEDWPSLKGLSESSRDEKLFDVATKYYETIHRHIRKYDQNHLILGDRYNGDVFLPDAVLEAAKPYIDVLSVQYYPGNTKQEIQSMKERATALYKKVGLPILIPDIGNWTPTELNPQRDMDNVETQADRGQHYVDIFSEIINEPWLLGWHWCGYIENLNRGWGMKDPWDEPYSEYVDQVADFNRKVYDLI